MLASGASSRNNFKLVIELLFVIIVIFNNVRHHVHPKLQNDEFHVQLLELRPQNFLVHPAEFRSRTSPERHVVDHHAGITIQSYAVKFRTFGAFKTSG